MEHLFLNQQTKNELNTKKICDLQQVMKKRNQFPEETSFSGSHKGDVSEFHLLENVRQRRQRRI